MDDPNVVIIGAGLAGLACALRLLEHGIPAEIVEAASAVGGRARTDLVDGFRLDRGFQVYLTGYQEGRRILDYDALRLRRFEPGAYIWANGRWAELSDPFRRPWRALAALTAPIGRPGDKWLVRRLRADVLRGKPERAFSRPESTTADYLERRGFSPRMIRQFFKPFYGGVFLDPKLEASSRLFEYTFRLFASGSAAVPAAGMQAIAEQMAAHLPAHSIHLGAEVSGIDGRRVVFRGGGSVRTRRVVFATDAATASRLTGGRVQAPAFRSSSCFYFATDRRLGFHPGRKLLLNGDSVGPVNNACVLSAVAPEYAPRGQHLISATIVAPERWAEGPGLEEAVRAQLSVWFQDDASVWRKLREYRIPLSLPILATGGGGLTLEGRPPVLEDRLAYVCGDYCSIPAIEGALLSGRRAAEAIVAEVKVNEGGLDWSD